MLTAPSLRCVVVLLALAGPAAAQSGTSAVVGTVRDSSGAPVSVATISIARAQALSDTAGRFALGGLPAGRSAVTVRRLGFLPFDLELDLAPGRRDSLFVTLMPLPRELPGVTTAAESRLREYLTDFYRHKESGTGRYYDRAEIDDMRVTRVSDVLRRVPGIRVEPDRNGRTRVSSGRMSRNCPPDVWLDNVRAHALNPDDIPLTDIEAMEVYAGPAGLPPEYINRFGNPACGAIVIWTRMPG